MLERFFQDKNLSPGFPQTVAMTALAAGVLTGLRDAALRAGAYGPPA